MQSKHPLLKYAVFLGIVAAGIGLSLLTAPSQKRTRAQWPVMGTVAGLVFRGGGAATHEKARTTVQRTWETLNQRLSAWRTDSELCRLAPRLATDGAAALPDVPADVRPCYTLAFDLQRQSGGAFNPVIGEALQRIGFSRQTPVDLGAVAKGFAVDVAYEALDGACDMLLDLGGNLRARAGTWHTGVRDPFHADAYLAAFDLKPGEAVATSGNYERFIERDGKRISHILDARTGQPMTGIAGVTVLAGTAMLADGLSTTLFVLGPEAGTAFLKRHYPGTAALWIPDTPDKPVLKVTVAMATRLIDPKCPIDVMR